MERAFKRICKIPNARAVLEMIMLNSLLMISGGEHA